MGLQGVRGADQVGDRGVVDGGAVEEERAREAVLWLVSRRVGRLVLD